MENKMRTLSITKIFERCLDCPQHRSEQMNDEFCYNERPYRKIADNDTEPFPEWCKAKILGKEDE